MYKKRNSKKGMSELFRVLGSEGVLIRSTNNNLSLPGLKYNSGQKRWPDLSIENYFSLIYDAIKHQKRYKFFGVCIDPSHIPYIIRNFKIKKLFAWRIICVYFNKHLKELLLKSFSI